MLTNLLDGLNSFGAAILESMGMDRDTAQRMVTEVCEQYKESTKWKMTMVMYAPFGRWCFDGCWERGIDCRMYCAVRKL